MDVAVTDDRTFYAVFDLLKKVLKDRDPDDAADAVLRVMDAVGTFGCGLTQAQWDEFLDGVARGLNIILEEPPVNGYTVVQA